jgi:iron complex outermembrane receptor protein
VGSKTTPEIRWRWRPVEQVMLRASFGKGFRAPSLTELYQPTTTGVSTPGLNDPARCDTTQSSNDCATQFNIRIGGTPNLKPETSTNYTLGLVFEPTTAVTLGFDAFKVKLKNPIIFGIDPSALLAGEDRFPGFITRGAPTADCPGCPGPVQQIDQQNLNLGATNIDGVDTDLRYRIKTDRAGTFTLGLVGTYFTTYEIQQPDGTFLSVVGRVSPIVNGAGITTSRSAGTLAPGKRSCRRTSRRATTMCPAHSRTRRIRLTSHARWRAIRRSICRAATTASST